MSNFHTFGCACYILDHWATGRYWKDFQMGTSGADGYLFWAFAFSCIKCWIDFESAHRTHFATISCGVWWWFHHRALSASNWSSTLGWIGPHFLDNCIIHWKHSWNMAISPQAWCLSWWFCIGYCECWHCIFNHFYSILWGRWLASWGTTKIEWLNKWCSATKARIMRSRAMVQICLQLN